MSSSSRLNLHARGAHDLQAMQQVVPASLTLPSRPPCQALQDVGDERSRTEAEFFYYVSQVSGGSSGAETI